jgi:glycosyltransferase involved in cell wall biosynthesis
MKKNTDSGRGAQTTKKIVYVIGTLNMGGAEQALLRLVVEHAASSQDTQQIVVSLTELGVIGEKLQGMGVDVITLHMTSILSLPGAVYKLWRKLRFWSPNVVHTWLYYADLVGGLAARLAGIKNIIWGIHSTQVPQGPLSVIRILIFICSVLSRWIPLKIICCAQAARDFHVRLGYQADKMIVVENGYDLAVFKPSQEIGKSTRIDLGIAADAIVVGAVGRFDPLKDYKNLMAAAERVLLLHPSTVFLFIGRGVDNSNSELMGWISETKNLSRFLLLGERYDVPKLMAAMDIFCLSSRAEAFPNVVIEAMAMQLPCVVTDVGDAALMVKTSGLVVPAQNSSALANALCSMIELSASRRTELGEMARHLVETNYSIASIAKRHLDVYFSMPRQS